MHMFDSLGKDLGDQMASKMNAIFKENCSIFEQITSQAGSFRVNLEVGGRRTVNAYGQSSYRRYHKTQLDNPSEKQSTLVQGLYEIVTGLTHLLETVHLQATSHGIQHDHTSIRDFVYKVDERLRLHLLPQHARDLLTYQLPKLNKPSNVLPLEMVRLDVPNLSQGTAGDVLASWALALLQNLMKKLISEFHTAQTELENPTGMSVAHLAYVVVPNVGKLLVELNYSLCTKQHIKLPEVESRTKIVHSILTIAYGFVKVLKGYSEMKTSPENIPKDILDIGEMLRPIAKAHCHQMYAPIKHLLDLHKGGYKVAHHLHHGHHHHTASGSSSSSA